ncbi:MAG: hypothetical protein NVS9B15_04930 [Acidobacteriaceae bacterium]
MSIRKLAIAIACLAATSAFASPITGQIGIMSYMNKANQSPALIGTQSFVVPTGTLFFGTVSSVSTSMTANVVHLFSPNGEHTMAFSGEKFTFPNFLIGSVKMTTNLSDVTYSWDAHNLYIRFTAPGFAKGGFADFAISGPASTPEPGSLALLGTGLLGGLALMRRKFGV